MDQRIEETRFFNLSNGFYIYVTINDAMCKRLDLRKAYTTKVDKRDISIKYSKKIKLIILYSYINR